MRVLFLDQFSELGGAQLCLAELIPALVDRGWSVTAMLPSDGPLAEVLRKLRVAVEFVPCGPYTSGRKTVRDAIRFAVDRSAQLRAIVESIATYRQDVIYVNGPRLLPAAAKAAGTLPVLFHAHSYLSRRVDAALVNWQLRKPNVQVIASSEYVARPLHSQRLQVIYNGIPEIPFRQHESPAGRPWRIAVIGRIAPEKGQLEFVQAAHILQSRGFGAEYFIHGAKMFSSQTYFDSVHIASRGLTVHFTGWHASVGPLLGDMDILVVPSPAHESTTRVVLEAYSAGTPVIAFATGGIPEVVQGGTTGILVKATTPEALAEAILTATQQPGALESMVIAARRKWEEQYTLARYQTQVADTIEAAGRRRNSQNNSAETSTTAAATSSTGP